MTDASIIYLGTGYLTCSPIKAVGSVADGPQARTRAPQARGCSTSASRRRTKLLKATCGLATANALFVTLLLDKRQYAGILPLPEDLSKMHSQFTRKLSKAFPQGYGFWKLELDSDRHGVHFHMILNPYAGQPEESQVQEFTAWARKAWGKIACSQWDRLVDVRRALPEHPGYLARADKKASDAALADYMGERHTYGTIGRQNAPQRRLEKYTATRAQMLLIREAIASEIRAKARYRSGIANQRHLSQVEVSNYLLHVGMSKQLEQEIKAILTAKHEDAPVEQKQAAAQMHQARHSTKMVLLGALGTSRACAGKESTTECRRRPFAAILERLAQCGRGEGLPPVSWWGQMGATGNMPPPRQSVERLRGP